MRLVKIIFLWFMPSFYLIAGAVLYFRGLYFLNDFQNRMMGLLLAAYSIFRFYRAYKTYKTYYSDSDEV